MTRVAGGPPPVTDRAAVHHIFTVTLLLLSWLSLNHRIGSLVLICHDVGDVFLPIGKCYSYAEEHIRKTRTKRAYEVHKMIGTGFFILFIVAFVVPRLFFFGGIIVNMSGDALKFQTECFPPGAPSPWTAARVDCGEVPGRGGPIADMILLTLLELLYPFQVVWSAMIARMAFKVLFAAEYDDVRSEDEE